MNRHAFITDVEGALQEYACAPQAGLERFKTLLLAVQEKRLSVSDEVFHSRLRSLLEAVSRLLSSGSPYVLDYHVAFLSASDALLQILMGSQFGTDRAQQLAPLLSVERPSWNVVCSLASQEYTELKFSEYHASLGAGVPASVVSEHLAFLASIGTVSFHAGGLNGELLSGYFVLHSAQPLPWLQFRCPDLDWEIASENAKEAVLRDLCGQSVRPIFQHTSMQKQERRQLLNWYECQLTQLYYREFGSLFASQNLDIKQADRMLPIAGGVASFACRRFAESDVVLPIRHGGVFYAGVVGQSESSSELRCSYLGKDYLPSFLYEIDTKKGRFVFDQVESIGFFSMTPSTLRKTKDTVYFTFGEKVEAQVQFGLLGCDSIDAFFTSLPPDGTKVLVVDQAGKSFALPFNEVRQVEAICSLFSTQCAWAKNVWLDREGTPCIEPWLIDVHGLSCGFSQVANSMFKPTPKEGYYVGYSADKYYVIEAELVSSLGAYQAPFSYAGLAGDSFFPFIIWEGRCLERVITADPLLDRAGLYAFSIILDWFGEVVVLPLETCQWSAVLPAGDELHKIILEGRKYLVASEQQDSFVMINKTNYLSFIDELWPSSLSLKSDR